MTTFEYYQSLYNDSQLKYGQAQYNRCPGCRFIPYYRQHLLSPIIDLGCGTGETVIKLRELGYNVSGVDWIRVAKEIGWQADITKPLKLSQYTTAICLDVFEHIYDEPLQILVENMKQCSRQVITVSDEESKEKNGIDLHINRKRIYEWKNFLQEHFEIVGEHAISQFRHLYLCANKQ